MLYMVWISASVRISDFCPKHYLDGKEKNKHASKKLRTGRWAVGKAPVIGIKDRATNKVVAAPVRPANRATAEIMIEESVKTGTTVYSDQSAIYTHVENLESVNHGKG